MPETMGSRLRKLREERNESKAAVGRAVGVTGQAIGRYETDDDHPAGMTLLKLSQHFGVSTAYLLCETDDPKRNSNLPPDWEELVKRIMGEGFSPQDIDTAVRMLKAFRDTEKREG